MMWRRKGGSCLRGMVVLMMISVVIYCALTCESRDSDGFQGALAMYET